MNPFSASILPGRTITVLSVFLVLMAGLFLAVNQISQAQGTCGFEDQYDWYQGNCNGNDGGGAPRELTLTANPASIQQGSSSLLSWGWNYDLSGASPSNWTCSIDNGVGNVEIPGGTRTVYPSTTTTYTIDCTVTGVTYWGKDSQGNDVYVPITNTYTSSATVNVTPGPSPTATLTATPSSITVGGSSTLAWSSTNATSCTGTGFSTGGAASGSVSVSPTATANYSVACTGPGGTANANATVEVTPSAAADLTAGSVSPASATAGSPIALSATASNVGTGASGSFPILFQVSETGALFNSGYLAALAAGSTGSGSASYTFPSAGTYSVRACANFNTAWTAITTESNYDNNCGPWTTVTVATAQTPALSCSVSSTSVSPGQSVTYSANPSGGATGPYTWTAADGGSYGTGSTASRSFSTPGTYAMNVSGSNAGVSYCPNVIVAASWCMSRPTELTITATPNRVRVGQSVALNWTASGVNGENATCTVSGPGVSWSSVVTGVPECSASGSANTIIQTQSTYTLTCAGVSKSVTVNVIPNFQEF
ncbi:MAG: CARDB domain-containing protein [bacterium]|nr:CARDB domain-containing protein [bacterium]